MKCIKFDGWSRLVWHNFVKVGDNWIKICNLALIGTHNRCEKFIQNFQPFGKNCLKTVGGFFLTHTVDCIDIARRSSATRRQTTLRWQKQVFMHTRLSRAYLALARLSCYQYLLKRVCESIQCHIVLLCGTTNAQRILVQWQKIYEKLCKGFVQATWYRCCARDLQRKMYM